MGWGNPRKSALNVDILDGLTHSFGTKKRHIEDEIPGQVEDTNAVYVEVTKEDFDTIREIAVLWNLNYEELRNYATNTYSVKIWKNFPKYP
jgi:flagellar basal body P-ring protein FlgI